MYLDLSLKNAIKCQNEFAVMGFVPVRSHCIYSMAGDPFEDKKSFRVNSYIFTKDYLEYFDLSLKNGQILIDPEQNYVSYGHFYEMWIDIVITFYTYAKLGYPYIFLPYSRDNLKKSIEIFKKNPKLQVQLVFLVTQEGLQKGFEFFQKAIANYR